MIAAAVLTAAVLGAQPLDARLMRWPTIKGNTVVFTYAGDLWTCELDGGMARRLTSFPGLESRSRFSPDGKTIAFTGQIDGASELYTIPAEGGEPKRLTFDAGGDNVVAWTPDGKIAYYNGAMSTFTPKLFMVSPEGGQPTPTKLGEITDGSFSPDGSTIAFTRAASHNFNWRRYRGGTQGRIGFFNFATSKYDEIPSGREQNYHPMWVGDHVYFISDKNDGGLNLYRYSRSGKRTEQLTKFQNSDIRWPSTDGKTIIWERSGKVELYDIASGKVTEFKPNIVSDGRSLRPRWRSFSGAIEGVSLSPSGKRVAVAARGDIWSVPATTGETRPMTSSGSSREKEPQWSPDGQSIAYLSDEAGEWTITVQPQMGGEAKKIKLPADHKVRGFGWSSTGKYFGYVTFDMRICLVPADGKGEPKVVNQDAYGQFGGFDFSHDDSYIVFSSTQDNLFGRMSVYEVATGKTTPISSGFYSDSQPVFDLTGKYIYFVSSRTYGVTFDDFLGGTLTQQNTQRVYVLPLTREGGNIFDAPSDEEPVTPPAAAAPPAAPAGGQPPAAPPAAPAKPSVKIDFAGIENRARPLPWGPGSFSQLIGGRDGVYVLAEGGLQHYSIPARQAMTIMQGIQGVSFNPARTKFVYQAGPVIGIADARPGAQVGAGRVSFGDVAAMWDPKSEYKQMFWEVWRWQRDVFYDPKMMGLDWNAIGRKYAPLVESVGDRSDLNYVLGQMIGELGTGHAYVQGGETDQVAGPAVGVLGADLEPASGGVRFAKIYRGFPDIAGAEGPLFDADVKEGDFLVAVNGQPVTDKTPVASLLLGTAGKSVTLSINARPGKTGARDVKVKPVANDSNVRYHTWVEERRAIIDRLSGGKIGYMHVPDTSFGGIVGFMRGFFSQSGKQAWIIDERFNGGGFIPTFFVEYLEKQMDSAFQGRNGKPFGLPTQSLIGPKAMLINEYAGSGGDMFPWLFKNRKLGPLIGTRTWGGLVGIQGGVPLVDGGNVTSPGFGIFDPVRGEWIAENKGVDPDMVVDNNPEAIAKGEDPQLVAAINYLLDELKKGKGRKPIVAPTFPKIDPAKP